MFVARCPQSIGFSAAGKQFYEPFESKDSPGKSNYILNGIRLIDKIICMQLSIFGYLRKKAKYILLFITYSTTGYVENTSETRET